MKYQNSLFVKKILIFSIFMLPAVIIFINPESDCAEEKSNQKKTEIFERGISVVSGPRRYWNAL